ncbi:phasin family protein [Erythrobacter crassostreae]|uniref:Phasin family protein n=1 Tax=Erythrobacter crassostreae TaxID=2828328 RepID=A0A9X1F163_9SPHN|nr:phasin family protein [Erythrobacter crassostrea]MBV7258126.1 phasin family protein [Erythrobacter crassostrea]
MAEANTQSKIDAAAEQAYADAAAKTASTAKVAEAVQADAPKPAPKVAAVRKAVKAPAKRAAAKKTAAQKTAAKPAAKKAPAKKAVAAKTPAKTAAKKTPAKKPVAKKAPATKAKTAAKKAAPKTTTTNPVTKLRDTIMATAEKNDFAATAKEMAATAQERVKAAYGNAGEFAGEFGEFNKANVDAVVESGKIFFTGAQELAKDNVETGKTVVETVTADAKKMVAVKSPTELFQMQGELARRNFDAVVGYGSKRTEAWVKLYNDAFAPISNRVSVAAEKMSKAA